MGFLFGMFWLGLASESAMVMFHVQQVTPTTLVSYDIEYTFVLFVVPHSGGPVYHPGGITPGSAGSWWVSGYVGSMLGSFPVSPNAV